MLQQRTHQFLQEEKTEHSQPEKALWRAVILTVIQDLRARPLSRERFLHKQNAINWFESQDMHRVCVYADFDPDWFHDFFRDEVAKHTRYVNAIRDVQQPFRTFASWLLDDDNSTIRPSNYKDIVRECELAIELGFRSLRKTGIYNVPDAMMARLTNRGLFRAA